MKSLIPLLALFFAFSAFATEDRSRILDSEDDFFVFTSFTGRLTPGERFDRAESVFQHFGAPPERPLPSALEPFTYRQNLAGFNRILPVLDPKQQFKRFFALAGNNFQAFLDRDQLHVADYRVSLAGPNEPLRDDGLLERFRRAAQSNPRERPLQGLKIAIDPGHMGGDLWDERTGKQVKDKNGNKLSEGMLNLQSALLLEREFERLGAQVELTHSEIGTVSSIPYDKLPIREFGLEELRSEVFSPWFENLLASGPAGPGLYNSFAQSPQFKKLFSENSRWSYYVLREDLAARWKAIEAFQPDITLIIHFDASGPGGVSPVPRDGTKVYVVGSFDPEEFATQKARLRFSKHLADPEAWSSSLGLGRKVVGRLKGDLKIGFDRGGGGSSFEVEPGIFARNLGVSAALSGHAVTYIEVLHYDDPNEFRMLRDYKYSLQIGNVSTQYSDRLVQVVNAIKGGVLDFVHSYASR